MQFILSVVCHSVDPVYSDCSSSLEESLFFTIPQHMYKSYLPVLFMVISANNQTQHGRESTLLAGTSNQERYTQREALRVATDGGQPSAYNLKPFQRVEISWVETADREESSLPPGHSDCVLRTPCTKQES